MVNTYVAQIVRTAIAYVYTYVASLGFAEYFNWEQIEAGLVVLLGSVVYAVLAALEKRFPWIGNFLGLGLAGEPNYKEIP